jgi:hypothetical protein
MNWLKRKMKDIFHMDRDVIHIELEDLLPEPEVIVISEKDLEAVVPVPLPNLEDIGPIEIPDIPCAICHAMIEPGQPFGKCKVCNTPYHKECWEYNGGCAVLGCAGGRNLKAFLVASML